MNNSILLSPALLEATAVFTVALSVLMVAAHTQLLAGAARRTPLAPAVQFRVPLLAAVLLSAWLGWAVLAVSDHVVAPEPPAVVGQLVQRPVLLIEMAAFAAAGIARLLWWKSIRTVDNGIAPARLIGLQ